MLKRREIDFQIFEMLEAERLCAQPAFLSQDRETIDAILDSAQRVADETFVTHAALTDAEEPQFVDGRVRMRPEVKSALNAFVEGGFMGTSFPERIGGLQLPYIISQVINWIFSDANVGTAGYPFLTMAAANLIQAHGSDEQKQRYMLPLIEGRWFGTMCLSEPQAGSSLADIRTRAEPTGAGDYRISGTKMWISGGEHELSENIVHLVLAKVPGQAAGTRGISLFIVPKYRLDEHGAPGPRNDVSLAGLNHKMGYRGTVNTLLNFGENDDCRGYLIGQLNQGLAAMFHMMNEARIGVGLNAAVLAYSGYQHSLDYARNRPQGRPATQRDPSAPQSMIIEHADVRHMLMRQKVYSEGALALCLYGASLVDRKHLSASDEQAAEIELELSILTPLIKAWSSHYGLKANYWGLQILGGYGYTRDYPLERIYRDNRLNPIHEGTNGIQSLDLLGRKVLQNQGAAFRLLMTRIGETVSACTGHPVLGEYASQLHQAQMRVLEVTTALGKLASGGGIASLLANSWTYLDMLGHLVVAWMWLRQAVVAQVALDQPGGDQAYYDGKRQACAYFYRWELPQVLMQADQLLAMDDSVLTLRDEHF